MTSQKATSQKALFDNLKVSLKNNRWSWGGIRADGAVFLRVWEDEKEIKDNREFVRVTDNKRFKNQVAMHPGYKERLDHLARIQNVAKSYMVICVARDVDAIPRVVKYFDSDKLYLGGELMEAGGNIWLEIVRSVPIQDVLLPSP